LIFIISSSIWTILSVDIILGLGFIDQALYFDPALLLGEISSQKVCGSSDHFQNQE